MPYSLLSMPWVEISVIAAVAVGKWNSALCFPSAGGRVAGPFNLDVTISGSYAARRATCSGGWALLGIAKRPARL